jgi:hypothetical protein
MKDEDPIASVRRWAEGSRQLSAAVEILIAYDLVDRKASWVKRGNHTQAWIGYWVDFDELLSAAVSRDHEDRVAMKVAARVAWPRQDRMTKVRLLTGEEEIPL